MQLEDFSRVLLPAGFLALGAFLTAVRGKIASTKQKNNLHVIFYVVSGIVALMAILEAIIFWGSLFPANDKVSADPTKAEPNWIGIISIAVALTASFLLARFTKKTFNRQVPIHD